MKGYYRKQVIRASWVMLVFMITSGSLMFGMAEPPSGEGVQLFAEAGSDETVYEARILEEAEDGGDARLSLIREAESEIRVVYHTFHEGNWMDAFFSELFRAADRGVQVTVVADGMLHQMRGDMRGLPALIGDHEQMALYLYEPPEIRSPKRWNNRLHDKLMIVDDRYVMSGGRNIGDKYLETGYENPVLDRDVLIRVNGSAPEDSAVIRDASAYVKALKEYDRTRAYRGESSIYVKRRAERLNERLMNVNPPQSGSMETDRGSDWLPVDDAAFVANPLEGVQREPVVWATLADLINEAENDVVIQTPYLLPDEAMMAKIDLPHLSASEISVVTNSLYSSPNYPAFSAYLQDREAWLSSDVRLYEFRGNGSIHAKSMLIDDNVSIIGSFNVDPRSAYLNTESVLVLKGEAFAAAHRDHLDALKDDSALAPDDDEWIEEETPFIKKRVMERLSPWTNRFKHLL